jgi:hypothetical protein
LLPRWGETCSVRILKLLRAVRLPRFPVGRHEQTRGILAIRSPTEDFFEKRDEVPMVTARVMMVSEPDQQSGMEVLDQLPDAPDELASGAPTARQLLFQLIPNR